MENSKEQGKKKIKEEDLGTVSGGCGGGGCLQPRGSKDWRVTMKCLNTGCNYTKTTKEEWRNVRGTGSEPIECPKCHQITYKCVEAMWDPAK